MSPPIVLLDGQSTGVSRVVIGAFTEECLRLNKDINRHMKLFPNPYAANPALSNDPKLLPTLKEWRMGLLRSAHAVLVFDGGMGTEAEIDVGRSVGCRIIPLPGDPNGLAMRLLNDADIHQHLPAAYLAAARGRTLTVDNVTTCIRDVTT